MFESYLRPLVIYSFHSLPSSPPPTFQFVIWLVEFLHSGFLQVASLGFAFTCFPDLMFLWNWLLTLDLIHQHESRPYTTKLIILKLLTKLCPQSAGYSLFLELKESHAPWGQPWPLSARVTAWVCWETAGWSQALGLGLLAETGFTCPCVGTNSLKLLECV